jgi:uncharacterized protein with GYD domain
MSAACTSTPVLSAFRRTVIDERQRKQMAKAGGAQIKGIYYVMGRYDAVVISEAPDDETAVRMALGEKIGWARR